MVKFVSYDGEYQNPCPGTLVVEIDGKEVSFGRKCLQEAGYPKFWRSSGGVSLDKDWSESATYGEWELSFDERTILRKSRR